MAPMSRVTLSAIAWWYGKEKPGLCRVCLVICLGLWAYLASFPTTFKLNCFALAVSILFDPLSVCLSDPQ